MRNKPNPKDFILSRKSGETLLKKPGEIRGYDFVIENLKNCTVYLLDRSAQITVDECTDCRFYVGPVQGSIFFRDCADCTVSVSCQQLRTKDCHRLLFNVFVNSDPAIENSDELQFGPYNFAYPRLDQHLSEAELEVNDDHWSQIFDFNRVDGVSHWKLQDPREFKREQYRLENEPDPVDPIPKHQRYGGTLAGPIPLGSQSQMGVEDSGGMIAFGIGVSQSEAQGVLPKSQDERLSDPFADRQKRDFDPFATGARVDPFATDARADPFAEQEKDEFFSIPNPPAPLDPSVPVPAELEEEDELDEDARSRIRESELKYQEMMKALYEKEELERTDKAEKRQQAAEELRRWREERSKQLEQRKQYNRQQEEAVIQARRGFKEGTAWKKVSSMIDFKEASDRKDMARMRQVLLAKKNE